MFVLTSINEDPPFGLSYSPDVFEEVVNNAVSDFKGVGLYQDNLTYDEVAHVLCRLLVSNDKRAVHTGFVLV